MTGTALPTANSRPEIGPLDLPGGADFVEVVRSLAEFAQLHGRSAPKIAFEKQLALSAGDLSSWVLPAWCRVCGHGSLLHVDLESSDGITPNFWERLVCPTCSMSARQRFLAEQFRALALSVQGIDRTIRIDGNPGAFGAWASGVAGQHPGLRVATQPEEDRDRPPTVGIFSIDLLPSVVDLNATLRDVVETLAPGGRLVLSIPFHAWAQTTTSLAEGEQATGPWRHQLGWDLMDRCRVAGFADAYALVHWSSAFGYLGNGTPLVLIAEKA
jgi:hypothetical protein